MFIQKNWDAAKKMLKCRICQLLEIWKNRNTLILKRFLKCVKMSFVPPKSEIGCKEMASMKNNPT